MGWLVYLQITLELPALACTAGMMGVMAGFIPWTGLQFAKLLWRLRRANPSGAVVAVVMVLLVGLIAIMRVTGEFTEQVYGSYVPLFTFGFVVTVPFGLSMAVGLWYVERDLASK
jgi:hypothetical protein